MKHGKHICNTLKAIRLDIARANGIEYAPRECHHEGECAGTCPACESEVRFLEREIARKRSLGKAAIVAGVSLGLFSFTSVSCDNVNSTIRSIIHSGGHIDEPLQGEVAADPFEQDSAFAYMFTTMSDSRFAWNDSTSLPKAVFPGGKGALQRFIKQHFVCPEGKFEKPLATFEVTIDQEGRVLNPQIIISADSAINEEALRVIQLLPKFEPAQDHDGSVIESQYYLLFDARDFKSSE